MAVDWRALLLLICLAVPMVFAAEDVFVGGDFLVSVMNDDDDNLTHIASFAGYMPDEDKYDDIATGGVTSTFEGTTSIVRPSGIQWTPRDIYALGVFQYVNGDYSQSVARYKNDDDDWESCNYGIWTKPVAGETNQAVNYAAGLGDMTVFAGDFKLVESYTISALQNNLTSTVGNLVTFDDNDEWAPLPGWPSGAGIVTGLSSNGEDTLYIAEDTMDGKNLYRWTEDSQEAVVLDTLDDIVSGTVHCSSNGDVYYASVQEAAGAEGSPYPIDDYYVGYVAADSTAPLNIKVLSGTNCSTVNVYPVLCAYGEGVIVAVPNENCETFGFETLVDGQITREMPVADLSGVTKLVEGDNSTVWALTSDNRVFFNADPASGATWSAISFASEGVTNYVIHDITYDWDDSDLFVYGTDIDGYDNFFYKVKLDQTEVGVSFDIVDKDNGNFAVTGKVNDMASVVNSDGSVDVYVGGVFDYIGEGATHDDCKNLAILHEGSIWGNVNSPEPVVGVASFQGVVYFAYSTCSDVVGESLPLQLYNPEETETIAFYNAPSNAGPGAACVYTLHVDADASLMFVGGYFTVSMPGVETIATGAVVYHLDRNEWTTLNIPATITNPDGFPTYYIDTFSVLEKNGHTMVLIGGSFTFSANGNKYESLALYDMTDGAWQPVDNLTSGALISSSVYLSSTETVIGGTNLINEQSSSKMQGVMNYDIAANSYSNIGTLEDNVEAVLVYTGTNGTFCYAGGLFETGIMRYNISGPGAWSNAGANVFYGISGERFYSGYTHALEYAGGGQGEDGQNGVYSVSSFSSSSGGGSKWWLYAILVIFVVVVVIAAVVVLIAAAVVVVQKKQRINYENV